ncbi:MAG: hypothetical protein P9L92_02960 [Candidatus Electryonea clarkiae]|nr:hypothetical protein [Candidatus Electryonea clarkiae]MDP8288336.1 hypothetical protein [Candidatus Electryonea clarkiae]
MNNKIQFRLLILLILTVLLISMEQKAHGTPFYAAKTGTSCMLCHQSPTGAGMRNEYGARFFAGLAGNKPATIFSDSLAIDPQLARNIRFGMNFRPTFISKVEDNEFHGTNSFVVREATLFTLIQYSEMFKVIFASFEGGYGASVQADNLFNTLTLRFGRLIPGFGWDFPDEKSYLRRFAGLGPIPSSRAYENGFEIGLIENSGQMTVAYTNGSFVGGEDVNGAKTLTTRMYKWFKKGNVNTAIGGNYRYAELWQGRGLHNRAGGLLYGINFSRLTYLGEFDLLVTDRIGIVSGNHMRLELSRGIYLDGLYELYQLDIDSIIGNFQRSKLAVDVLLYEYIALTPAIEYTREIHKDEFIIEIMMRMWL